MGNEGIFMIVYVLEKNWCDWDSSGCEILDIFLEEGKALYEAELLKETELDEMMNYSVYSYTVNEEPL